MKHLTALLVHVFYSDLRAAQRADGSDKSLQTAYTMYSEAQTSSEQVSTFVIQEGFYRANSVI